MIRHAIFIATTMIQCYRGRFAEVWTLIKFHGALNSCSGRPTWHSVNVILQKPRLRQVYVELLLKELQANAIHNKTRLWRMSNCRCGKQSRTKRKHELRGLRPWHLPNFAYIRPWSEETRSHKSARTSLSCASMRQNKQNVRGVRMGWIIFRALLSSET